MTFKRFIILCLMSLCAARVGFALTKGTVAKVENETLEKLDLATLKQFAINHNMEIQALRRSVEELKAQYERSKSPFYPHLGLVAGLESQSATSKNQMISLGYLSLNYSVFSGFEDSRKKQMADLEIRKALIRLESAEFQIGLEVEKVFHTFVFKKGALALRAEHLKVNDLHRKMANQKRAAGMATESDVMEFDLSDALIKSDMVLLEQELEESKSHLKKLLGEEIGRQIEPVGVLRHEHLQGTLKALLENIEASAESIMIATKELSFAAIQRGSWTSKWFPKIEMEGQIGYLPLDQSVDAGAMARGLVLLKWNFFEGFDTVYERKAQEFNYLKTEASLKQIILEKMSEVEIVYAKVLAIQKRVDLEEKNEGRAKAYYMSVTNEYRRGIKNSSDLKSAAEGLFEARLRRENFKYEFLMQKLNLEKSIGSSVKTELISE